MSTASNYSISSDIPLIQYAFSPAQLRIRPILSSTYIIYKPFNYLHAFDHTYTAHVHTSSYSPALSLTLAFVVYLVALAIPVSLFWFLALSVHCIHVG